MPMDDVCGDWLLRFGAHDAPAPRRHKSGSWHPEARHGGGQLLLHPPGDGWKGSPWHCASSEGWSAWLLGETYPPEPPFSAWWRNLARGSVEAAALNGHFLLLACDRERRRWHLWTDPFGSLHAYRAAGRGGSAIGTFFPAVAAASRRQLDWEALAGFFTCGFFLEDRTFFDDVRILRPATHYVFDHAGEPLSAERYRRWSHRPDPGRGEVETIDELGRLLAQVIDEQTRDGRVALPLSGGLDSRSTLAALPGDPGEREVLPYSYGYSADSVEVGIARRLAAARRLALDTHVVGPYLFGDLERVVASVEGFQDVTQCRQAAILGALAPRADAVIAAHWGDVWLDDVGFAGDPESSEAVLTHTLGRFVRKGHEWLAEHLCRPRLGGEQPLAIVRRSVRHELAPYSHLADGDFRIKAFKTDSWSFRWTTTSLRMYQPAAFPRLPFYDTRLVDFFATVPTEAVRGRKLQVDYLKRHAPDLARVTWQAYDTSLYLYPYFNSLLLPKRAVKKLLRSLRRRRVAESNWQIQFLGEAGRRQLEQRLLAPGLRVHDLVAPLQVRELVEDFYRAPNGSTGYAVSMLLTFAVWLETHG